MPVTSDGSQTHVGGQTSGQIVSPDTQTPKTHPTTIVAPHLDSIEFPDNASFLVNKPCMTIYDQKMFERFRLMNFLTYTRDLMEDAHEFIVSCHERLHNL